MARNALLAGKIPDSFQRGNNSQVPPSAMAAVFHKAPISAPGTTHSPCACSSHQNKTQSAGTRLRVSGIAPGSASSCPSPTEWDPVPAQRPYQEKMTGSPSSIPSPTQQKQKWQNKGDEEEEEVRRGDCGEKKPVT